MAMNCGTFHGPGEGEYRFPKHSRNTVSRGRSLHRLIPATWYYRYKIQEQLKLSRVIEISVIVSGDSLVVTAQRHLRPSWRDGNVVSDDPRSIYFGVTLVCCLLREQLGQGASTSPHGDSSTVGCIHLSEETVDLLDHLLNMIVILKAWGGVGYFSEKSPEIGYISCLS